MAYEALATFDSAGAAQAMCVALRRETNGYVLLAGLHALGSLKSKGAHAAILDELSKSRGRHAIHLIMAIARQKGSASTAALVDILRGDDPAQAAQAALALGEKAQKETLANLLEALDHQDWRVVAAAARGIEATACPPGLRFSDRPPDPRGPVREWFPAARVLSVLARRLATAQGVERGDLIQTLETISKKEHGWNVAAWEMVAAGREPDAATLRRRKYAPQMFGVPLYGRRIVVVFDGNLLIDNAHPFRARERLESLCQVAGGHEVPWFTLRTIEDFSAAHVARGIRELPTENQKFELIFSKRRPEHVFGRLVTANSGNKGKALKRLSRLRHSNGGDIMSAMDGALDISGRKDAVAWQSGPDTVLCVYSSIPWLGKETVPEVVGAHIGLKAGARMVRVETVGVARHSYQLLNLFAELSGGTYTNLVE